MKAKIPGGIALLCASLAALASPAGRNILNLPGNLATEQDKAIVREAVFDALEKQPDAATARWHNPATGNHGLLRSLETYHQDGLLCRRLQLRNSIDHRVNDWVFNFCKLPEGDWKVAPSR